MGEAFQIIQICLSICLNRFRNVDSGCEQNSCNIYMHCFVIAMLLILLLILLMYVPHVVYHCKPESRIKSEICRFAII